MERFLWGIVVGILVASLWIGARQEPVDPAWALDDLSDECLEGKEFMGGGGLEDRMILHLSGELCWVKFHKVKVIP